MPSITNLTETVDMTKNRADTEAKPITVYVAYAPSVDKQLYVTAHVKNGMTILDVLAQVGWVQDFPDLAAWCEQQAMSGSDIDNKSWRVGVYAQKQPLNYVLKAQDRVEVYRPLSVDPMLKRQKRAGEQH